MRTPIQLRYRQPQRTPRFDDVGTLLPRLWRQISGLSPDKGIPVRYFVRHIWDLVTFFSTNSRLLQILRHSLSKFESWFFSNHPADPHDRPLFVDEIARGR